MIVSDLFKAYTHSNTKKLPVLIIHLEDLISLRNNFCKLIKSSYLTTQMEISNTYTYSKLQIPL